MKKALVTGASRGIGYAIAGALAGQGYQVVITGRKEDTLLQAARELGPAVQALVWDAGQYARSGELIRRAAEMLGGLDVVVNNAGLFAQRSEWSREELLKTTPEEWSRVMDVNTGALFFVMQAAVNYMLAHGISGNILNITSVAGEEPVYGAYGASKIAATGLTRGWGRMFAPDHITINGIAPGPVATLMNDWHEGDPMEHDRIPYGRFATTEEIAKLALYLVSEDGKMVCGETVILDGGYAIR